ncbi:DUF222 domain-containing protein [Paeniglutamicibacter sp. NPDC012692]|uniref:DUF222 domain-containing protein n=1 Tax=Paeniglutamicibacter sp. NPDC012692 TaxID=3364388 RepID=UPI00368D5618
MTNQQDLAEQVVAAIDAVVCTHPDRDAADDGLRLLAVLKPVFRVILDRAAASVGPSQVRAAAFVALAEDFYRIGGYGQVLAAARATDARLHTITEAPLAEVNELLAEPAAFVAGECGLPDDAAGAPGRKPLYRDEVEFLKTQQNLTHFQALHRVETAANLLPHAGFNGREVPPKFPLLGKVFSDATADPRTVAGLAKKLEAMGPEIGKQADPDEVARRFEAELAAAVATRNSQGTATLLKDQARRLDAGIVERREESESMFIGAYYLGHSHKGYEYRLITNAEGHELLATAADILNNPTTKAGTTPAPESNTPPLPIPEWAIDPALPPDRRPAEGFGDTAGARIGPAGLDPGVEVLPGETLDQAYARQRAQRLHQFVLDSIRIVTTTSGKSGGTGDDDAGQMPMLPHFTLAVTIDFQTLKGQLENAGVTDHGQDISASNCRRIACNAGIVPIVLNGDGVPLELGRTRRYFNRAQRRAIAARDKGCCNPGCSMPVNRTEAHHLDEWSAGGRTDVSRGCLLCVRCHVNHHSGHFRIVMLKGLPHVIRSKSVDPAQTPRRNWIFHPAVPPPVVLG